MLVDNDISNDQCSHVFAKDGPFSTMVHDYQPRDGQQEMASLIENVIVSGEHLVVEAPSGSGKTLAYLVPVLMMGKKTIISTASQHLQHQLYFDDIPLVQNALKSCRLIAVLKGRNNYLCPYYLEKTLNDNFAISNKTQIELSALLQRFRHSPEEIDSQILSSVDSTLLHYATCGDEACLGLECPQFSRCPLMKAREKAEQADVVIVNHSLLFADQAIHRENFTKILPSVEVVVVDEAHRLAEFAQTLMGHWLSSRQLKAYCYDAINIISQSAPEQKNIQNFVKKLNYVVSTLGEKLPSITQYNRCQHIGIIEQLATAIDVIDQWLEDVSDRAQNLSELETRTKSLKNKLRKIQQSSGLCWIESSNNGFVLQNIPTDISQQMALFFKNLSASWVFTSATLSVLGSAERFLQSLGLPNNIFHRINDTMNYAERAGLYLPLLDVEPNDSNYTQRLTEYVLKFLRLVDGRVLFLFTSHKRLRQTAKLLMSYSDKPLFVQGTHSNRQLITAFKHSKNGLLLGTGSFWEGLDLSGIPLKAVIIDKLPFASLGDPLVKLRSDELRNNGVNSFEQYLLPDAVIRLQQGCGRLLRRLSDKGVIMIADPRIHSKFYGDVFINSLPAMTQSSQLELLEKFLVASSRC